MSRFCLAMFCLVSALHSAPSGQAHPTVNTKKADTFKPFTGKIIANKVRLRVKPDLESHVLRQVNKDDLLLILAEEGEFYAIQPPKETKAYIFRSYVLDDRVEANRVNVRLEPHIDAPIIAQLQAGDNVKGRICPMNHKWLEIDAPKETRFYVSKEYVVSAGGPEFLPTMEKRKGEATELLNSAFLIAETECKKPFEQMTPQPAIEKFQAILRNYSDFHETANSAKEALALLKETYLNKKIEYLESKAELSVTAKEELLAKHRAEKAELFSDASISIDSNLWTKHSSKRIPAGSLQVWSALEESLYLSWTAFHSGKKIDDFYAEQKANASVLTGTIEPYVDPIKDRPGDFILHRNDGGIAYLYSTHIDLAQHVGKIVNLLASPRPNNYFAFPAYFVLAIE